MNTMTAAIISMAATAIVWANTVEAVFLVASFMAMPLHPWLVRLTACHAEFRSRVIAAANGAMTPCFYAEHPKTVFARMCPHVTNTIRAGSIINAAGFCRGR